MVSWTGNIQKTGTPPSKSTWKRREGVTPQNSEIHDQKVTSGKVHVSCISSNSKCTKSQSQWGVGSLNFTSGIKLKYENNQKHNTEEQKDTKSLKNIKISRWDSSFSDLDSMVHPKKISILVILLLVRLLLSYISRICGISDIYYLFLVASLTQVSI